MDNATTTRHYCELCVQIEPETQRMLVWDRYLGYFEYLPSGDTDNEYTYSDRYTEIDGGWLAMYLGKIKIPTGKQNLTQKARFDYVDQNSVYMCTDCYADFGIDGVGQYPEDTYIKYESWQDFTADWSRWDGKSLQEIDDISDVIYMDEGFIIQKI